MTIKCFYHSADLDGHCSGAIVKFRFPEAVMHPINYGDTFPWDLFTEMPRQDVYIVDFALQPFMEMHQLAAICNLHWIDHHKSAISEAEKMYVLSKRGKMVWSSCLRTHMEISLPRPTSPARGQTPIAL